MGKRSRRTASGTQQNWQSLTLAASRSHAEQHREGGELWQPEGRADPAAYTVERSWPAGRWNRAQ